MSNQTTATVLPGFTAAETVILAAAYFHARSADVSSHHSLVVVRQIDVYNFLPEHKLTEIQVDFEQVCAHIESKSVASVRERLRLARKKEVEVNGNKFKSATVVAAGDCESKTTKSPRKAKAAKATEATEDKPENEDSGAGKVIAAKKAGPKAKGTKRKASEASEDEATGKAEKKPRRTKRKVAKTKLEIEDDSGNESAEVTTVKTEQIGSEDDHELGEAVDAGEAYDEV